MNILKSAYIEEQAMAQKKDKKKCNEQRTNQKAKEWATWTSHQSEINSRTPERYVKRTLWKSISKENTIII